MTTREQIISAAKDADTGFDGGPDADGTMEDSIVGIDAVERFYSIAYENGRVAEREECAKHFSNLKSAYGFQVSKTIRARTTK